MIGKSAFGVGSLYVFFAVFSPAINILAQMVAIHLYKGLFAVGFSIFVAAAAGLPLRRLLEKRYISNFVSDGLAHDGGLILISSFMGVFTTGVFWILGFSVHLVSANYSMRYFGGFVDLASGYCVKYRLNKESVFAANVRSVLV